MHFSFDRALLWWTCPKCAPWSTEIFQMHVHGVRPYAGNLGKTDNVRMLGATKSKKKIAVSFTMGKGMYGREFVQGGSMISRPGSAILQQKPERAPSRIC